MIIQVWISTHFGVISKRLGLADPRFLFIKATLTPPESACKASSLTLEGPSVRAPPAPPDCHASFRSSQFGCPTASRPRTRATKPTPVEPRTPPERFVRARLRCSSRASLPLTPQAGTPTATIGMRPATALRTKAKSVKTTPSGCRASWVLLRVQCCPRPYRPENALSKKV